MKNISDWLVNLGDFLKYYKVTPGMLLLAAAILLIVLTFSLRELVSWLTRANHLRRKVDHLKHCLNTMENKIDQLIELQIKKNTDSARKEKLSLSKSLDKKTEPNKVFGISH